MFAIRRSIADDRFDKQCKVVHKTRLVMESKGKVKKCTVIM